MIEQTKDEEKLWAGIKRMVKNKRERIQSDIFTKDELENTISEADQSIRSLSKLYAKLQRDFNQEEPEGGEGIYTEIQMHMRQKAKAEKKLRSLLNEIKSEEIDENQELYIFNMAKAVGQRLEVGRSLPTLEKRKLLEMLNLELEFFRIGKRYVKVSWGFGFPETIYLDEDFQSIDANNQSSKRVVQRPYSIKFEGFIYLPCESENDSKCQVLVTEKSISISKSMEESIINTN